MNVKDIEDELCACGHKKSQHNGLQGHGSCQSADCQCKQFTWVAFIMKFKGE